MRALKVHDVQGMTSVDDVLLALEEALMDLALICDDIRTEADRQVLKQNLVYLKSYYERIERLLLDKNHDPNQAATAQKSKGTELNVGSQMPKQRTKISWSKAKS